VISPAVAWASAIQVAEAMKALLGHETDLHGSLWAFDVWKNRDQKIRPERDPQCRTCGLREFPYLEGGAPSHTTLCGRDAVEIYMREPQALDLETLRRRLERFGPVRGNAYLVRFSLGRYELTVFTDGRAIVKGTDDPAVARGVYAKYVGS
jgi:adenylyltransferase/sulfurtransferase